MTQKASVRTHFPARSGQESGATATCAGCGQAFAPARSWQKFHSDSCRKRAWEKRRVIGILIEALEEVLDRLTEKEVPHRVKTTLLHGAELGRGALSVPRPVHQNSGRSE